MRFAGLITSSASYLGAARRAALALAMVSLKAAEAFGLVREDVVFLFFSSEVSVSAFRTDALTGFGLALGNEGLVLAKTPPGVFDSLLVEFGSPAALRIAGWCHVEHFVKECLYQCAKMSKEVVGEFAPVDLFSAVVYVVSVQWTGLARIGQYV